MLFLQQKQPAMQRVVPKGIPQAYGGSPHAECEAFKRRWRDLGAHALRDRIKKELWLAGCQQLRPKNSFKIFRHYLGIQARRE